MRWTQMTVVLLAFACAESVRAREATDGLADVTTIQDEQGHARILFNWNTAIDAEHFAIRQAILRFDLTGDVDARKIRLVAHPITKAWDPSTVTWTRGWSNPGGDFDREHASYTEIDLSRGAGSSFLDLTYVAKEVEENGFQSYGLILTTPPEEGEGIRVEDLSRFGGLSNATLEVSWRKTPPPPTGAQ